MTSMTKHVHALKLLKQHLLCTDLRLKILVILTYHELSTEMGIPIGYNEGCVRISASHVY